MIRIALLAPLLLVLFGSTGFGQQWAEDMFDHTSHDFGTVARGAKAEHRFTLENIYEEDAHIASISSSCGCAEPEFPKRILKTWDKAQIVVKLDTRGHFGRKDATLTVRLDKPFPAEVRLHIHTYIRRDVVVQPEAVQFGTVAHGKGSQKKVTIDYAGRSDWQIVRVECANPHLQAQIVQQPAVRSPGDTGQVSYDLSVSLKADAPVGYIRDRLILVTNDFDPRKARVPILVEGVVAPPLTAQPSPLSAMVDVGQSVTRRLVVKGIEPFTIVSAHCTDRRFKCTVLKKKDTLYLVSVTFAAGTTPGRVSETIRIETDLTAGTVLEVPVHIDVTSPAAF